MTSLKYDQEHSDLAVPLRSEREIAANAVWALIAGELLPRGTSMVRICRATGLTLDDLRVAQQRAERCAPGRLLPTEHPTRPLAVAVSHHPNADTPTAPPKLPAKVYDRERPPQRGDLRPPDAIRLHPRARRVLADHIFAEWKVRGNLDCTRCGQPICSGEEAVVMAAHHARDCTAS